MGIPKFFRWISERYPLTHQSCGSANIPVMDNLYLDMNGIIHNCTHGNDPNVKLSEEDMVVRIFEYIDRLFSIVQPQKLLFAAIDGCAPRAKLNQQRGRRFKAAKEAAEAAAKRKREGEDADQPVEPFDSNCITPGTAFMGRLSSHLHFFFRKKIAQDPAWQKPLIIFSGHDVPGEGEHKIMEHIRWAMKELGYQANQRHCFYGLDADLIMLSLVTHEPHFCLLREVISYSSGAKGQPTREVLTNPKKEHFILFQVGLLREYMELELAPSGQFPGFNIEHSIDDFVLMCMLIGNDFLPTLPTLDVNEGALDEMLAIYKELLPQWRGHLVESGQLNLSRLESLLSALAQLELETLQQRASDAEYFENKRGKRGGRPDRVVQHLELDEHDLQSGIDEKVFGAGSTVLPLGAQQALEPAKREPQPGATMMSRQARALIHSEDGVQAWKERYYREKLELDPKKPADIRQAVEAYVQGLHWVLEYYYRGVASWSWYYPYHYSPMASDLRDLGSISVGFERGQPLTPYQQLLAVLPAASHKLLPKSHQWLMTAQNSPIIDYYPLDFTLDGEGKRQDWEAVVVLKFIDIPRLQAAEQSIPQEQLTDAEKRRNTAGHRHQYMHDPVPGLPVSIKSTLPSKVPDATGARLIYSAFAPFKDLPAGMPGFVPQLYPGSVTGRGNPAGFPTLKTLSVLPKLKAVGVTILGQPSKRESLTLTVSGPQQEVALHQAVDVGQALLKKRLWINWPYLQEAEVIAVSDAEVEMRANGEIHNNSKVEGEAWLQAAMGMTSSFRKSFAMEIGQCKLTILVRPCEGLMRQSDNTIEKKFSAKSIMFPVQVALGNNPSPDPRLDPAVADAQSHHLLPGSSCIFLGQAHYGCVANILPTDGSPKQGLRVAVQVAPPSEAAAIKTAKRLTTSLQPRFLQSHHVATSLRISPRCLSLLTGNIFVKCNEKRHNLGLRIKDPSNQMCVPDYAKQQEEQRGWMYSELTTQVLTQYKVKFPWLMKAIESSEERQDIEISDALPEQTPQQQEAELAKVTTWLKQLPLSRRQLVKVDAEVASEQAIRSLQAALPPSSGQKQAQLEVANVNPSLLLPAHTSASVPSALTGQNLSLGCRVAFVGVSGGPLLGARGTVVGKHEGEDYEILFDAPFPGGTDLQSRCQGACGLVLSGEELLNLTVRATPSQPKPIQSAPPGFQQAQAIPQASSQNNVSSAWVSKAAHNNWLAVQAKQAEGLVNGAASGQLPPGLKDSNSKAGQNAWLAGRRNQLSAVSNGHDRGPQSSYEGLQQGGRERLVRKVRDPPGGSEANFKGFSMGRGRTIAPPLQLQQIASAGQATPSAGIVEPAHPSGEADSGQIFERSASEHKVHGGISALHRLSQQDLTALAEPVDAAEEGNTSSKGLPVAPPGFGESYQPPLKTAMQDSGAKLLAMLQRPLKGQNSAAAQQAAKFVAKEAPLQEASDVSSLPEQAAGPTKGQPQAMSPHMLAFWNNITAPENEPQAPQQTSLQATHNSSSNRETRGSSAERIPEAGVNSERTRLLALLKQSTLNQDKFKQNSSQGSAATNQSSTYQPQNALSPAAEPSFREAPQPKATAGPVPIQAKPSRTASGANASQFWKIFGGTPIDGFASQAQGPQQLDNRLQAQPDSLRQHGLPTIHSPCLQADLPEPKTAQAPQKKPTATGKSFWQVFGGGDAAEASRKPVEGSSGQTASLLEPGITLEVLDEVGEGQQRLEARNLDRPFIGEKDLKGVRTIPYQHSLHGTKKNLPPGLPATIFSESQQGRDHAADPSHSQVTFLAQQASQNGTEPQHSTSRQGPPSNPSSQKSQGMDDKHQFWTKLQSRYNSSQ